MKKVEGFPVEYAGARYDKRPQFINDVAWEILKLRPRNRKAFGASEWLSVSPESYALARDRGILRVVIGRVNHALGYHTQAFDQKPIKDPAKPLLDRTNKRLMEKSAKGHGNRKYPDDKAELVRHLAAFVSQLRGPNDEKITTVDMWRKAHEGSLRSAQAAGVVGLVAEQLALEYRLSAGRDRMPES